MTTITTRDLQRRPGIVRQMAEAGQEFFVTFHRRTLAVVIPGERRQAELDELESLRAEVERLNQALAQAGAA